MHASNSHPPPDLSTTWRQVLTLRLARQQLLNAPAPASCSRSRDGWSGSTPRRRAARAPGRGADRRPRAGRRRRGALDERPLVKTWAFRQTLHLLAADDVAAFVRAARSLERWHRPAWQRYFEMTEAQIDGVIAAIGDILGAEPKTRVQIVDAVVERAR